MTDLKQPGGGRLECGDLARGNTAAGSLWFRGIVTREISQFAGGNRPNVALFGSPQIDPCFQDVACAVIAVANSVGILPAVFRNHEDMHFYFCRAGSDGSFSKLHFEEPAWQTRCSDDHGYTSSVAIDAPIVALCQFSAVWTGALTPRSTIHETYSRGKPTLNPRRTILSRAFFVGPPASDHVRPRLRLRPQVARW
jgi:hypothetical protein